jgi:hypothetical protein
MADNPQNFKVINRLDIVVAYLSKDYEAAMFVNLFNAGDIFSYLLKETGPIKAEDLIRWTEICMRVAE